MTRPCRSRAVAGLSIEALSQKSWAQVFGIMRPFLFQDFALLTPSPFHLDWIHFLHWHACEYATRRIFIFFNLSLHSLI